MNHMKLQSIIFNKQARPVLAGLFFLSCHLLRAQDAGMVPVPQRVHHLETVEDQYLPNEFGDQKTSVPYSSTGISLRNTSIFTSQVNVNSVGANILSDAANEPSIAVNPMDKKQIVIGWRQFDNINSNFRQAGWNFSNDGGLTWSTRAVINPGIFRSDPVLDADLNGTFYYNSLAVENFSDFLCDVYRSGDGGASWDEGIDAFGGDKQWMTIDRTGSEGTGNIYAFWSSAYSICAPEAFTRSSDGGDSYDNCVAIDGDPYWGTMAVGKAGELFIVGGGSFDNLVVVKSSNAKSPGSAVDWDFAEPVNVDGELTGGGDVNPGGLLGQANIDVDVSDGPYAGYVYVLASVNRISVNDPGDVMFARSTDGGLTWDDPVKVNDDASVSNYQWFGTLAVADNGRIDAVWLDTRDASDNSDSSALYYSFSMDGGSSWSVNERLSDLFDPHVGYPNQEKMGDYFDMVSDSSGAYLAWANTLNGEQDVYFSFIQPQQVTAVNEISNNTIAVWPNPADGVITIQFSANQFSGGAEQGRVEIFNALGKQVYTANCNNSKVTAEVAHLPSGIYVLRLTSDEGYYGQVRFVKE
jgi:hypothetical protein